MCKEVAQIGYIVGAVQKDRGLWEGDFSGKLVPRVGWLEFTAWIGEANSRKEKRVCWHRVRN